MITLTLIILAGKKQHMTVPVSVIVQDEFTDTLGSLGVDASGCQQHVEQLENGDDGMELDFLRRQHLHTPLLSVHEHNGISHLQQIRPVFQEIPPTGDTLCASSQVL